jgi:hypothetical protein
MSNKSKLKQFLNLRKQWNNEIAVGNVVNPNLSPHAAQNALAAASGGQTSAQLAQMANAPEPERSVAKPRRMCKGLRCTVQGGKRRMAKRRYTKRRYVKH